MIKCRRVFQSLINIAIEELCEIADSLIAPVRMGVARPTAPFSLVSSNIDAIQVRLQLDVKRVKEMVNLHADIVLFSTVLFTSHLNLFTPYLCILKYSHGMHDTCTFTL